MTISNFNELARPDNYIELTFTYDVDLSQMYYDEWAAENTGISLGRDNSAFIIGDATQQYYKKSHLAKLKKAKLAELCEQYGRDVYDNKKDLVAELSHVTIEQHYKWLASECSWYKFKEAITHDYYVSTGYSKGDAVILINADGNFTDGRRKYINNILWDSPIYASIEVNGEEYSNEQLLGDDQYEYDLDAIKARINALDIDATAKSWICEHLPEYPEYI